ncbi:MAG: N-acetylmuramic acid 6-phosphate etherase [Rhodobacteraceae bacterium]|nr:N-acetylmuramic acid 6-phosphate etherase [Paracoccaceae bacterium]
MIDNFSVSDLNGLISERRNPHTTDIDLLSITELVAIINSEDKNVAQAVEKELSNIARAVEHVEAAFRAGGRLVYIGAGTSGRLGVLDASECPPTFSVPPDMVLGIIAGGDKALRNTFEGAEDSRENGARDLESVELTHLDVVVGVAVSGRTPYVIGALDYAQERGAVTVALTCNPNSELSNHADIGISPVVGPGVLSGPTRLKSGTAQKLVLNMLSTAAMIRIGKTYENLMVDLSASNRKLRTRAIAILCETTGIELEEAETLLTASGYDVKCAILMNFTGLKPECAKVCLDASGGVLRKAIAMAETQQPTQFAEACQTAAPTSFRTGRTP